MSAFSFRQYSDAPTAAAYAYMADATLPNGVGLVRIDARRGAPCISLAVSAGPLYSVMNFSAEQARTVAAELLAAARAIDGETCSSGRA